MSDVSKTFFIYPAGKRDECCVISITAEKIDLISSNRIEFVRNGKCHTLETDAETRIEEIGK